MKEVNTFLSEIGISKVKLAKYLGVSRQMLYNYLAMESLKDLPKKKVTKILFLLGVEDINELSKIKIDSNYLNGVEERLNEKIKQSSDDKIVITNSNLNKQQQLLLNDTIDLLKQKLIEDKSDKTYNTLKYLYSFLQSVETNEELRYVLAYFSKALGFTEPLEFTFDERKQIIFESIMFSGMNLYTGGGASKSRIAETHKKFVQDVEHRKEERLSRTQELNATKVQALRELGYREITKDNAKEVLDKIAEIESRKV